MSTGPRFIASVTRDADYIGSFSADTVDGLTAAIRTRCIELGETVDEDFFLGEPLTLDPFDMTPPRAAVWARLYAALAPRYGGEGAAGIAAGVDELMREWDKRFPDDDAE
jgi:hypothetical protein